MAPPRLFTRFALVSGIALAVAVALALLFTRSNAHDRAKTRAVAEATAVAKQFADNDLARTAFDWPRPGGEKGRDLLFFLDDFFVPTVDGADAAKVTLYARNGTVTYAADRNLIGSLAGDAGHAHAAIQGPQYVIADGVQNTYVPVTSAFEPGRIRGVMRLEHDYAPIASEIRHEFLTQAAIVALALIGLYLAMLPIMRRVTLGLRRGYVERAQLAAIVDHSNDAVIGVGSDGVITSWNAAAEGVYGWTADEAVGKPIDAILPEKEAIEATEIDVARTTHVRKDGAPVVVSVTISPIRDQDGKAVGSSVTARDVTEVSRLEQELRESHRQEAVGRLAGGLAHDFSDVLGEIDSAAANLLLDPTSRRDLERIRTATARGSSLSDQLQAVGGGQIADPELLDLNEAVRAAAPRLNQLAGSGIVVTTELEDGLGAVFADREQIDQLIVNLVANARGSMPLGGRITIETAGVDFERRSRDGDREPGHYVMFSVTDTGSLAAEAKARPFEPFYRQNGGGDGRMALALAAVSGIVKQSGGTMGVESRPEGGTVIRIYLPRVGAAAPEPTTA